MEYHIIIIFKIVPRSPKYQSNSVSNVINISETGFGICYGHTFCKQIVKSQFLIIINVLSYDEENYILVIAISMN